jgi:hypothetical protein
VAGGITNQPKATTGETSMSFNAHTTATSLVRLDRAGRQAEMQAAADSLTPQERAAAARVLVDLLTDGRATELVALLNSSSGAQ